jgi:hypothetical protein
LDFDFSGVALRVSGLPEAAAAALARDWAVFVAEPAGRPLLDAEVSRGRAVRGSPASFDPKAMRAELGPFAATFRMPQGRIELDDAGRARLELASGIDSHEYYALLNLLRAGLAWRLLARGGALLHAAGLVTGGRGFVLAGAEGSGKTTWSREGERGGASVVSDDLVILDPEAGGFALLGGPFRSTHPVAFRRGRWPLAAILFPRHGDPPTLAPVPPLLAQARIVANLPFVAEALDRDDRLRAVVARLVERVPFRELTFAPDPGYLELLRAL